MLPTAVCYQVVVDITLYNVTNWTSKRGRSERDPPERSMAVFRACHSTGHVIGDYSAVCISYTGFCGSSKLREK